MPRACAREVYGSVFVCVCVCVYCYSCPMINEVQVRASTTSMDQFVDLQNNASFVAAFSE